MQLQHYAWLIWRRLWLILLGTALCTAATYFISSRATPVYEAAALIQVTAPTANNGNDVFSNQALAVSDALQVTNDNVLREAAKELSGVTFAQLKQAVSASPPDNTQLIEVRADAATAEQAAKMANTVAKVFIQNKVAAETARLQGTADQISQQLVTAKSNLDQAQAQLTSLQLRGAPAAQIDQQTNLVDTYQVNYNSLLSNYNEIQLQKATMSHSLTLVQSASLPDHPVGSQKLLNTVIAAAMSFLLMLVLVVLLDWADVSIKTPEDVAQLALLEPLGSIPLRAGAAAEYLLDPASNDNEIERAFAIISTSFNALNTGQRSLLVTSLHAGTGTTTVAAKLAISLAQSGTRVLLVDANMHRPKLHQILKIPSNKGLSSIQADAHVLQNQPQQIQNWLNQWTTNVPNLWLLPAGSAAVNAVAILRSLELRKLIGWLLQEEEALPNHKMLAVIDIVIFDTPALEEEADTIALAPLCDSSILVIKAASERKEILRKAQGTLQRLGAPIIGVIVNRQRPLHRPYLYVSQSQQPLSSVEVPSMAAEVKYPLLKMQTMSLRAVPRFLSPQPQTPGAPPLYQDMHNLPEGNKDGKPGYAPPRFSPPNRQAKPLQGGDQDGNQ